MRSILKHIIRNIFEKKFRTTIFLITILLSTMVLFVGLSLNDIISNTYKTMLNGAYGKSNIVIKKESAERDPFYEYTDIDTKNITVKARIDLINASGKSSINDETINVSVIGVDEAKARKMDLIAPIRTVKDFKLEGHHAIISQKAASDYQLALGDMIEFEMNDEAFEYKVGAISETNGLYYSEFDGILLVVSNEQLNRNYHLENKITSTFIQVSEDKLNKAISTLSSNNSTFSIKKSSATGTNTREEERFNTAMLMAITIIVLISTYVIFSLSKITLAERMPVVGTFRSLGTSKRLMNCILMAEFLVYGFLGAVLGIVLGYVLLPTIADMFNEYKSYGVETNVIYDIRYMVLALIFGILFPVCISIIQIIKANGQPLKAMILNTAQTVEKRSTIGVTIGIVLLMGSFALYYLNRVENLLFAITTVLLLFISIVLLIPTLLNLVSKLFSRLSSSFSNGEIALGIKNITNNKIIANNSSMIIVIFILLMSVGMISTGIHTHINYSMKQDFDVIIGDLERDPNTYKNLENIDGVSQYKPRHWSNAQYKIKGNRDTFFVHGVEDFTDYGRYITGIHFLGKAKSQMEKVTNGIILDVYQAKRYGLEVGDSIQLQPLDAQLRPLHRKDLFLELIVAGVMDSSQFSVDRTEVLVNLDYYKEHFVNVSNEITVKVSPGFSADQVKKNIWAENLDEKMTVLTTEEVISSQVGTIEKMIDGVKIIIMMGMVVGLLGITNNLIISFMQRKKEYAVLYSICMSKMQIIRMLFAEMFMTFVAVIVIGYLGTLVMSVVWTRLLYTVGLRINFSFDFSLFGLLSGIVFVILLLSTLFIVYRVTQIKVIQELRYG